MGLGSTPFASLIYTNIKKNCSFHAKGAVIFELNSEAFKGFLVRLFSKSLPPEALERKRLLCFQLLLGVIEVEAALCHAEINDNTDKYGQVESEEAPDER